MGTGRAGWSSRGGDDIGVAGGGPPGPDGIEVGGGLPENGVDGLHRVLPASPQLQPVARLTAWPAQPRLYLCLYLLG
jgi:hypothetical protein